VTDFVGLTTAEVNHRIAIGATNEVRTTTSRTLTEIFRAHVFTRFNAVLGILLLVVFVANSPGDGLFGFVLLANSTIGVLQEWSAKRKLDALALLHSQTSCVIRNGEETHIPTRNIVIDDFIVLKAGDQVPADGCVVASQNLEINESNLTGESDAIHKFIDDNVLSGTAVVAGHGMFVATSVGATAYAHRLASEARVFTRVSSEIQTSITRVLTWVTWLLVAVTPLQVWSHFRKVSDDGWQDHVVRITAGLVGLVPEGLVLLTTLAFLSAALSLSRQNVLVQELPAVETLARVDVVCLDKTGTLTSGNMVCEGIEVIRQPLHDTDIPFALAALADDPSANNTLLAIQRRFSEVPEWTHNGSVPFDSTRKWKADAFIGHGTWFLGAPEMLWNIQDDITNRVTDLASTGSRVMLLCNSPSTTATPQIPLDLVPMALIILKEEIRDDAATTLRYFADQNVRTIVISGDNPQTVQSIAHAVGIAGDAIDARQLGDSAELINAAVCRSSIFGRVTPEQKRTMVTALQSQGHVVAMTGDGVNDSLALKRADIGIAMDNGAPATKAVAQIVLLDGKFSHLPHVLAEGRRVIGNVERVANLFLAKNAMSLVAILASVAAGVTFPILPRQMTLLSTVTIGLPAFALALGKNTIRYQPGFLQRIVAFSWPAGAVAGASVVVADAWTDDATGTAATLTALLTFFGILTFKSRPLSSWRLLLLLGMTLLAASAFIIPALSDFFEFTIKSEIVWKSVVTSLPLLLYVVTRMRKDSQEVF
jgi:cation-transporting ATPase E